MDNRLLIRNLRDVATEIRDGDLLLYRRRGLIAVLGRGVHSHAGKACWWGDRLFNLEIREFYGGRVIPLAGEVERYPRRIDVFRANPGNRWPEYDRAGTVRVMKDLVGCRYGYAHILRVALAHLPLLRWTVRPDAADPVCVMRGSRDSSESVREINRNPIAPFCSEACSLADRYGGGVDPIPHLADRFSEPADLARSPFYKYLFTLE